MRPVKFLVKQSNPQLLLAATLSIACLLNPLSYAADAVSKPAEAEKTASEASSVESTPVLETASPQEFKQDVTKPETLKTDSTTKTSSTEQEPLKARAVVVDIDSTTLNYDKEKDQYVATGSAHVIISEQNSELTADKVIYDQTQQLLFAEGHVVIIKKGRRTDGTYAKIDLTRQSALITDAVTTIQAVRIKAQKAMVDSKYIELENGKFIINGKYMAQVMANGMGRGGLGNLQKTGRGANQARLNQGYYQQIRQNQAMLRQNDPTQRQSLAAQQALESQTLDFSEDKKSRFSLRVKEIDVTRNEDGYDTIDLKWPSLYMGRFKIATLPSDDLSYNEKTNEIQYLGPDIGVNPNYGGLYLGPGWDFRLGPGAVRFSPLVSYGGNPYRYDSDTKPKGNGPGLGGIVHYRDPNTTVDLAYNSHVGYPVFFGDRRLFSDSTHIMASYRDFYSNGLSGNTERPNYIAQITDYRVLKNFKNFQLTSFESVGYAKDNFKPTSRDTYFVDAKGPKEITTARIQLQAQIQNVKPLLQLGRSVNFGFRGQALLSGYGTGDFIGLLRAGPTMNVSLFNRLNSQLGYYMTGSVGQTPFVFDSYYGGSQNMTLNNSLRVNDYLTIGTHNSLNLLKQNAQGALSVGNSVYVMVGPKDVKLSIGYDFISKRSSFGINFFPGNGNTVINYDRLKMYQPENFSSGTLPQTAAHK